MNVNTEASRPLPTCIYIFSSINTWCLVWIYSISIVQQAYARAYLDGNAHLSRSLISHLLSKKLFFIITQRSTLSENIRIFWAARRRRGTCSGSCDNLGRMSLCSSSCLGKIVLGESASNEDEQVVEFCKSINNPRVIHGFPIFHHLPLNQIKFWKVCSCGRWRGVALLASLGVLAFLIWY